MSKDIKKIKELKKLIKNNQHPAQTKDKLYLEAVAATLHKKQILNLQQNK